MVIKHIIRDKSNSGIRETKDKTSFKTAIVSKHSEGMGTLAMTNPLKRLAGCGMDSSDDCELHDEFIGYIRLATNIHISTVLNQVALVLSLKCSTSTSHDRLVITFYDTFLC